MTNAPFIDTNILLRHFTGDDADLSSRASAYLARIEAGEVKVHVPEFVLFETIFILHRTYKKPRIIIRDVINGLMNLAAVSVSGTRTFRRALDIFVELNISFADAYYVALMEQRGVKEIVSFDRDFDRVPGITRIEP